MTYKDQKIAVVIPCYKVRDHILSVVEGIPSFVDRIYCVDDACPEKSTDEVKEKCADSRIKILKNTHNKGVGGAVILGYQKAIEEKVDIIVKIDGDGQMDSEIMDRFVLPITKEKCDYTKGNRFYRIEDIYSMPKIRVFGNMILSFLTKLSSGYWDVFDPTNGYTAISVKILKEVDLQKISNRYFQEF